jgi:hypothetical protein
MPFHVVTIDDCQVLEIDDLADLRRVEAMLAKQ